MTAAAPAIAARFTIVIMALCKVVAAHIAADRNAGDWIVRVWNKLSRIAQRIERLAAQASAGTVPKSRAGHKRAKPRKPATRPAIVLAGRPGWLIHRIIQAAPYAEMLRRLLEDPEMPALLAAAPQLARVLRPLCRALGVPPPPLPQRPALHPPSPPDPVAHEPAPPVPASPTAPPEATSQPRRAPIRPAPSSADDAGYARAGPLLKPA